jgi:hypothetical protein
MRNRRSVLEGFGEEMQAAGLSEVFIIQGERGANLS